MDLIQSFIAKGVTRSLEISKLKKSLSREDTFYYYKGEFITYDLYYLGALNIFNKDFYSLEEIESLRVPKEDKRDLNRELADSGLSSTQFLESFTRF